MPRPLRTTLSCLPLLIATTLLTRPAQLLALDGGHRSTRIERSAPNRLDVLVNGADTSVQRIPLEGWVTTDLLAYRFRLVALDANGIALALPALTSLTLHVVTGSGSSQVRLSHDSWDFALPRPFAIRLGASDSIAVFLEIAGFQDDGSDLRVSIDFEPTDRRQTRLPLTSEHVGARPAIDSEASWEWQPTSDGRVLAMAGLPLANAASISLVDVESGATLWSSAVSSLTPGAAIVTGSVKRLCVPVTAGRTYRLTVSFTGVAPRAGHGNAVLAMMLPSPTR